jgi:hypothetical protein
MKQRKPTSPFVSTATFWNQKWLGYEKLTKTHFLFSSKSASFEKKMLFLTNICSLKRGRKRERVCLFFQIQSSKKQEERKRERSFYLDNTLSNFVFILFI